jgi:hypothetical protein
VKTLADSFYVAVYGPLMHLELLSVAAAIAATTVVIAAVTVTAIVVATTVVTAVTVQLASATKFTCDDSGATMLLQPLEFLVARYLLPVSEKVRFLL